MSLIFLWYSLIFIQSNRPLITLQSKLTIHKFKKLLANKMRGIGYLIRNSDVI